MWLIYFKPSSVISEHGMDKYFNCFKSKFFRMISFNLQVIETYFKLWPVYIKARSLGLSI